MLFKYFDDRSLTRQADTGVDKQRCRERPSRP